jgi:surfeit locus 1 family protein
MPRFRPYPGLTIATLILVAILTALGVWQVQRLHWKLALIDTMNRHLRAPPLPLDTILGMDPDAAQYRRVALDGQFLNRDEAYVFTTGAGGAPVYHMLTPFRAGDGKVLMVDRGEVPAPGAGGEIDGPTHVVGVWRLPDRPGFFTPKPDREKNVWYARDLAGIAAARHLSLAAPDLIEADTTPNPGGWPKGGQTVVDLPNNHLSYAVTWFGLAAGLIGVYLAYHISKGRLGRA